MKNAEYQGNLSCPQRATECIFCIHLLHFLEFPAMSREKIILSAFYCAPGERTFSRVKVPKSPGSGKI